MQQVISAFTDLMAFCFIAPFIVWISIIVVIILLRWGSCKVQAEVLKRKGIDISAGELFWGASPHEQIVHLKEKEEEEE